MSHRHTTDQIEVGPVDTVNGVVYLYWVAGYLSRWTYKSAQSALHDARRPQRFSRDPEHEGTIEPVPGS